MAKKTTEQPPEPETTALATTGDDILAALGDDVDIEQETGFGFEKKFRVPAIKFNNDDTPGQLFNRTTEQACDRMTVVFLYARKYRDYSVTHDDGATYNRVCSAEDAEKGIGLIEATGDARECKRCPHRQWSKSETGKRIKPACNEGYGVVGMDLDGEAPFLMRFQVTSFAVFDKLQDKYHGPQKLGNRRLKRLPLWMRRYEVSVEAVKKNDRGKKFYLPVIEPADPEMIPADQAKNIYETAKLMEDNFDQVMSFHRNDEGTGDMYDPLDEHATPGDFSAGAGDGFE